MRRILTVLLILILSLGSSAAQAIDCQMAAWDAPMMEMAGDPDCPMKAAAPQEMTVADCYDSAALTAPLVGVPDVVACADHDPSATLVAPGVAMQTTFATPFDPPPRVVAPKPALLLAQLCRWLI